MPLRDVTTLVEKLKTQKGIVIEQKVIPGANHFFDGKIEPLMSTIGAYLDKRLGRAATGAPRRRESGTQSQRSFARPGP